MLDGQSLVFAPSGVVAPNVATGLVAQLRSAYGLATPAISGTTYAQRAPTVVSRVDSLARNATRSILIDIGGTSDLLGGMSAAALLATVEAYADARRAAGYERVIELTVPPTSLISGGAETQRQAYNAALLANANGKFDAVVDVAGHPLLDDSSDVAYYSDALHWTAAGAAVATGLVKTAVAAFGIN